MVQANLRILLSCCYEPQFKVYAYSFDWVRLLPRLSNSTSKAISLATKLVSSCLASGLPDAYNSFWTLKTSDGNLLLSLLRTLNTVQGESNNTTVEEFSFSLLNILLGLNKLADSNEDNLQLLASKPILPVLSATLESGDPQEIHAVCLLLWKFLSTPQIRQNNPAIPCLTEQFRVLAHSSDPQLKTMSQCILMVLKEQDVKGNITFN